MTVRPSLLIAALCVASLLDWQPVRSAEQALSPVLRPADGLVRACLPDPAPVDPVQRAVEVLEARTVWDGWVAALRGGARPADAHHELALVPVVEARSAAQELIVRVPPDAVVADTPVTHHGVLLGFLRPWKRGGERVESGGLARVALLGNPAARPVAALWRVSEETAPVHFLLSTGAAGPVIEHASQKVQVPGEQLAFTRDVSLLGDKLPGGLLVGRVVRNPDADVPGGSLLADPLAGEDGNRNLLEPILDASTLGHVVIEVEVGQPWSCRRTTAGLFASTSRKGRVRLDAGRWSGIQTGDVVVQDGVLVGLVAAAGPWSAEVYRELPPGQVLVVSPDGDVVPTTPRATDWPAGWAPHIGWTVVVGHREHGGLLAGVISSVDDEGFAVELPRLDFDRDKDSAHDPQVTVLER